MLMAGDVGGTKTLLGLFEPGAPRPQPVVSHAYETNAFGSFGEILDLFARDTRSPLHVDAAVFGVAGPVVANRARLTNIDWDITGSEVESRCGTARVALLNDLEAMATSVEVLTPDEFELLQAGVPRADG